jgi:hypothetical protein
LLIFTEEYNIAMEFISEKHPAALPDVLKFKARASPFNHFMFSPNVIMMQRFRHWFGGCPWKNN